eukprot:scaffold36069_cov150-Skeletonema_dohrnii-CCMP3373.AAC.2
MSNNFAGVTLVEEYDDVSRNFLPSCLRESRVDQRWVSLSVQSEEGGNGVRGGSCYCNPIDNAVDKERASSFSTFWWYDLANCDAEPDAIGLIIVVEYTSAIPAFCPAVGLTEFEMDAHPVTEV